MSYLADACALICFWTDQAPDKTMPQAASILRRGDVDVLPTTIWEITRKASLGKLPRFWSPWPSLIALLDDQRFRRFEFTWEDAEAANALAELHRDPMDRILIAVAQRLKLTVITSDRIFRSYGVATLW